MRFFMLFILLMSKLALANEPTLIGGKIAQPSDFPEVLYISSGSSRCSATAIGKNVILTAAHCIDDGEGIKPVAEFVVSNQVFRAVCTHHPEYASKYSYDFALCKSDQDINVKWASISSKPVVLEQEVTLMGFGCTTPRDEQGNGGGSGGNDGRLRYGLSPVIQLPEDSPAGGYQYFYTRNSVALCFGDSGGPAMEKIVDPKKDPHRVLATNSRGNIRDLSLLSSTFLPGFLNWARAYAISNEVEICGINKNCEKVKPKCEREKAQIEKWKKRLQQCEESADTMDDIIEL